MGRTWHLETGYKHILMLYFCSMSSALKFWQNITCLKYDIDQAFGNDYIDQGPIGAVSGLSKRAAYLQLMMFQMMFLSRLPSAPAS